MRFQTVAEGVAVRTPGKKTFEIVQDYVDEIISIKDSELLEIFTILIEKHKMIAETAGILPLAALKKTQGLGEEDRLRRPAAETSMWSISRK